MWGGERGVGGGELEKGARGRRHVGRWEGSWRRRHEGRGEGGGGKGELEEGTGQGKRKSERCRRKTTGEWSRAGKYM